MELDREALLIYLEDLRTMETILHEDDNKIKYINDRGDFLDYLELEYSSFLEIDVPQKPLEVEPYEKQSVVGAFPWLFTGIFCLVVGGLGLLLV